MTKTEIVPDSLLDHLESLARQAMKGGHTKAMATGADVDEDLAASHGAVPGYYKRIGTRQWHRYIRGTVAELMALAGIDRRGLAIRFNAVLETPRGKVAMCDFCFIDVKTGRSILGLGKIQLYMDNFAVIGLDAPAEIPHDAPFLEGGEAGPWDDLSEQQGFEKHGKEPEKPSE